MKDFIITCHGWSASNWLAYTLNQHPELIVSHSAANLVDEKLKNNIQGRVLEFKKGYLNRQERPIAESYRKIRQHGQASAYGSVHLYRLRDLPHQHRRFGLDHEYNIINLVRNPIDLVWSGYGQFMELFRTDINELHWTLGKLLEDYDFCLEVSERHNLKLGDYEILAFFCAARVLGSLRLDLDAISEVKNLPNIHFLGTVRMEDITTYRSSLRELFELLFGNQVSCSEDYLDHAYGIGKINPHVKQRKKTGKELFDSFSDWQKEVFTYYIEKYQLSHSYSQYKYSLDFL